MTLYLSGLLFLRLSDLKGVELRKFEFRLLTKDAFKGVVSPTRGLILIYIFYKVRSLGEHFLALLGVAVARLTLLYLKLFSRLIKEGRLGSYTCYGCV